MDPTISLIITKCLAYILVIFTFYQIIFHPINTLKILFKCILTVILGVIGGFLYNKYNK